MTEFLLFARCFKCKKKKLYIAKRVVTLPVGLEVTSKEYFCGTCAQLFNNLKSPI